PSPPDVGSRSRPDRGQAARLVPRRVLLRGHDPPLARHAAAAQKSISAAAFAARDPRPGRHLDLLFYCAGLRIDAPQVALISFPRTVPQLAVQPGHAGYETIGLDRAQHLACLRIHLVNLPLAVLTDP